jgi:hypothetical protein
MCVVFSDSPGTSSSGAVNHQLANTTHDGMRTTAPRRLRHRRRASHPARRIIGKIATMRPVSPGDQSEEVEFDAAPSGENRPLLEDRSSVSPAIGNVNRFGGDSELTESTDGSVERRGKLGDGRRSKPTGVQVGDRGSDLLESGLNEGGHVDPIWS